MAEKKDTIMLVAIGLLAAVVVALCAVATWLAFELAALKRDKASLSDVDAIADEVEALSNIVMRSTGGVSTRLDKAAGDIRSASEADVRIQSQLARLGADLGDLRTALRLQSAEVAAASNVAANAVLTSVTRLGDLASSIETQISAANAQFKTVMDGMLSGGGAVASSAPL